MLPLRPVIKVSIQTSIKRFLVFKQENLDFEKFAIIMDVGTVKNSY